MEHGAGIDAIAVAQRLHRRHELTFGLASQPGNFKILGVPSPIERDEVAARAHQMVAKVAIEPFVGQRLRRGVLALRSEEEALLVGRGHPALAHPVRRNRSSSKLDERCAVLSPDEPLVEPDRLHGVLESHALQLLQLRMEPRAVVLQDGVCIKRIL